MHLYNTIRRSLSYRLFIQHKHALSCQLSIQYVTQHVKYSYTVVSSTYLCHALPVIRSYMLCSPSCHIMHHIPLHNIFTCMLPIISTVHTVHSQSSKPCSTPFPWETMQSVRSVVSTTRATSLCHVNSTFTSLPVMPNYAVHSLSRQTVRYIPGFASYAHYAVPIVPAIRSVHSLPCKAAIYVPGYSDYTVNTLSIVHQYVQYASYNPPMLHDVQCTPYRSVCSYNPPMLHYVQCTPYRSVCSYNPPLLHCVQCTPYRSVCLVRPLCQMYHTLILPPVQYACFASSTVRPLCQVYHTFTLPAVQYTISCHSLTCVHCHSKRSQ